MLREVAGSLRRGSAGRDPVALFRQLSHQYASSSAPSTQASSGTERTASVDALRQRLADGEQGTADLLILQIYVLRKK